MAVLKPEEIRKRAAGLPGGVWKAGKSGIRADFVFANFSAVLAFVVRAGLEAEKADHHPDILMHGWKRVRITLSTHSEGGVTKKDFALAEKVSKLAEEMK